MQPSPFWLFCAQDFPVLSDLVQSQGAGGSAWLEGCPRWQQRGHLSNTSLNHQLFDRFLHRLRAALVFLCQNGVHAGQQAGAPKRPQAVAHRSDGDVGAITRNKAWRIAVLRRHNDSNSPGLSSEFNARMSYRSGGTETGQCVRSEVVHPQPLFGSHGNTHHGLHRFEGVFPSRLFLQRASRP